MGSEITKFTRKLTDDAALWAVQQLACDKPATVIVKELYDKFNISITTVRIGQLTNTKRWKSAFDASREEYLNRVKDFTGIDIAAQRKRLQDADKLRDKLSKFIDKIEKRLDSTTEHNFELEKYEIILLRELRYLTETYFKALQFGKSETDFADKKAPSSETSIRAFLDNAKKAVKPAKPVVIDVELVNPPAQEGQNGV